MTLRVKEWLKAGYLLTSARPKALLHLRLYIHRVEKKMSEEMQICYVCLLVIYPI